MARVYGDSTPFPHDIDYIHMLRDGVDCAVRLLAAQHSIRVAEERAEGVERGMRGELAELNALLERVQNATRGENLGIDSVVRASGQIGSAARTIVDGAVRDLEARTEAEVSQAAHVVDKAREGSLGAIEQFLEQHTPPETRSCLSLTASPEQNAGHVTLHTPFGVSAVFGVAIGPSHVWARPRKVGDYTAHAEISMPKEAGWLSKRVEMAPVRLERLFITDLTVAEGSGILRIRRGPGTGPGYEFRIDRDASVPVSVVPVRDDGTVEEQHPLVLADADQAVMRGIWQNVIGSVGDLTRERQRLVSGTFNGRPLLEIEAPRLLADALVGHMAPVVAEISRRSGAPGELVLRRTLSEGRREETYCTHAELLDKIMVLPPDLRVVFSALHLSGGNGLSKLPPGLPPGQDVAGRPLLQAAFTQPLPVEPFAPADIEVTAEPPALPPASAPAVVRVS
jgi:hypothetical protein